MKRFHELTNDQQEEAVSFAREELKSLIEMGIVSFDRPVNSATLEDYAVAAAEEAWYPHPIDKIVEGIES